ncbi:MAG: triosephosphate isomerase [Oscillospiraceae bacterium]|jgi:triosephosphate isomerase|nr:triosephosphate isomerase [Oscillospiraceae bacterium]
MKHIFLNLKRFDIPPEMGGVNRLAPIAGWGRAIVESTQEQLKAFSGAEFAMFFPELHILPAAAAKTPGSPILLGCQSVYRGDTAVGGNFGAFTANRTANAMKAAGCEYVLIGHCEERNDKNGVLAAAGVAAPKTTDRLLNEEVRFALAAGMKVLFCIGEKDSELADWDKVLTRQLTVGLEGVDKGNVVIAYEPVWSIGPGKTPADKPYITKAAKLIKEVSGGLDVVYGGGLKSDNAEMLASIGEIDGGLIALTQFTGEIGFYPEQYIEIIKKYLGQ